MRLLSVIIILTLVSAAAHAEPARHATVFGPMGLSVIPSARMDEPGTIRAGVSTLDPYINATLGLQIAKPLYINIR